MSDESTVSASEMMLRSLRGTGVVSVDRSAEGIWSFDFSKANLTIESPWRIVAGERIVLGASDHGHQFGLPAPIDAIEGALKILGSKGVEGVEIDPATGDLRIAFSGEVRLDTFNDSSGYEGWNYSEVTGSVVAMGGGKLAIWERQAPSAEKITEQ